MTDELTVYQRGARYITHINGGGKQDEHLTLVPSVDLSSVLVTTPGDKALTVLQHRVNGGGGEASQLAIRVPSGVAVATTSDNKQVEGIVQDVDTHRVTFSHTTVSLYNTLVYKRRFEKLPITISYSLVELGWVVSHMLFADSKKLTSYLKVFNRTGYVFDVSKLVIALGHSLNVRSERKMPMYGRSLAMASQSLPLAGSSMEDVTPPNLEVEGEYKYIDRGSQKLGSEMSFMLFDSKLPVEKLYYYSPLGNGGGSSQSVQRGYRVTLMSDVMLPSGKITIYSNDDPPHIEGESFLDTSDISVAKTKSLERTLNTNDGGVITDIVLGASSIVTADTTMKESSIDKTHAKVDIKIVLINKGKEDAVVVIMIPARGGLQNMSCKPDRVSRGVMEFRATVPAQHNATVQCSAIKDVIEQVREVSRGYALSPYAENL